MLFALMVGACVWSAKIGTDNERATYAVVTVQDEKTVSASEAMSLSDDEKSEANVTATEDIGGELLQEEEVGGVQLDVPANIRLDRPVIEGNITKPLESARVSSLFGYRKNPVSGKYSFHSGYDLAAASGTEIHAMLAGRVSTAAYDKGYGNYIIIDHGGGLQTLYAHCSKLLRKAGDSVAKGDTIALVGSTGNSTGAHLHVEIRLNGQRYDPEWLLGGMYD